MPKLDTAAASSRMTSTFNRELIMLNGDFYPLVVNMLRLWHPVSQLNKIRHPQTHELEQVWK